MNGLQTGRNRGRPPRVLAVLRSREHGGAEQHLLRLALAVREEGVEMALVVPPGSWLQDQASNFGICVYTVPMRGVFDIFSIFKLWNIVRKFAPDILHSHLVRATHYGSIVARLSGVPFIATAHSTHSTKRFGRADRILAVSEAVQRSLVASGVRPDSVIAVHNGVPDLGAWAPSRDAARHSLGIAADRLVLVMVARFIEDKGHDIAVNALALLPESIKHKVTMLLVGESGNAIGEKIRNSVTDFSLESNVRFLGFRSGVADVLAASDVLIAPSRREAISLSILEALSVSLPVIGTDVGGIPEAVIDNWNGRIIPSDDPGALANAIVDRFNNSENWRRYARRSRRHFENQFSERRMVQATLTEYGKLCRP